MAHDRQYINDHPDAGMVKAFRFPVKGEHYWDRHEHEVVLADKDVHEKFLIMKEGVGENLP